jgi:maleate isomerase
MGSKTKVLASFNDLKKVGFVTPSSNTALEPVTMAMTEQIGDRISTHFSRVPVKTLTEITPETHVERQVPEKNKPTA